MQTIPMPTPDEQRALIARIASDPNAYVEETRQIVAERRRRHDHKEVAVLARLMRERFGRTRIEATQDATAILDALATVRVDLWD